MDNLSKDFRRKAMQAVRGENTTPERRVAHALRVLRIRYQGHAALPGRPDFALPHLRVALFVQGCFWHSHGCRPSFPKTNRPYWTEKLLSNVRRDRRVRRQLNRMGWSVIALWECRLRTPEQALSRVESVVCRRHRSPATPNSVLRSSPTS